MTADIGRLALGLALAVAIFGVVSSIVGRRPDRTAFLESGRTAAYSLLGLVLAANVAMEFAIFRNDFSIRYVAANSSRETPTFFKFLALWSADEGSLLLWNLILAGFIAAVALRFRRRPPELLPWVMAILYGTSAFYLVLVLGPTTPFTTLAVAPGDGVGPLPLLQNNPLMAIHPPMLYLGFIGFTVPFAFALAALITGKLSDQWIRITRRWTIAAWVCLSVGLFLGGLWSYRVLGWGGYWAWDPVENVALLPWLTATAFLHSVIIEERRGMLKVWNLSLIVATFALTTIATFLTRGSILDSVHAFAQSIVGPLYLGFVAVVLTVGFGLIALRSASLRSTGTLDAALSREGIFFGNNLVLLAFAVTVFVGTMFPLFNEALTGTQVSVGAPFFRSTTLPLALLLLLLAGVGPLISWRASSWATLAARLRTPVVAGGATLIALALFGVRNLGAAAAISLAAFVAASNIGEFSRGVHAFRRAHGGGPVSATTRAVARNRRLYGGLIVHLGVAVIAVAITVSSSFATQEDVRLEPGATTTFAGLQIRFDGTRTLVQPNRRVVVADLSLSGYGRPVGRLVPSLNLYPGSSEPIGSPSIRTGMFGDLYASFIGLDQSQGAGQFRLYAIPGMLWLWVGGAILVIGALVAGWPHRRARARRTTVPAPAAREEVTAAT